MYILVSSLIQSVYRGNVLTLKDYLAFIGIEQEPYGGLPDNQKIRFVFNPFTMQKW